MTSILDEVRVSSGTAVSLYLCHDASIHHRRGHSGGHGSGFLHKPRGRRLCQAQGRVNNVPGLCSPRSHMSSTAPRVQDILDWQCGYAMPSLRIRGELEPFHAWDRTRLGRPSIFDGILGAPHMVPTPAGICPDGAEKGVHGPVGSALGGEKVCQRVRGTRSSGPSIDPLFPDGLAIRIRPGLLLFPSFDVGDHRRCQKNQ